MHYIILYILLKNMNCVSLKWPVDLSRFFYNLGCEASFDAIILEKTELGRQGKPRQYSMSIETLSIFRNRRNSEWERIRTMFLVALYVKRWRWIWQSFVSANLVYKSLSYGRFTCRLCVLHVPISSPQFRWWESILVVEFVLVVYETTQTATYLWPKMIFMFQMSHYQRRLLLILQSLIVVRIFMCLLLRSFNHSIIGFLTGKEKIL